MIENKVAILYGGANSITPPYFYLCKISKTMSILWLCLYFMSCEKQIDSNSIDELITLEETNQNLIANVWSMKLSPNKQRITISDKSQGKIFIYQLNGKLFRVLQPLLEFSDSIAIKQNVKDTSIIHFITRSQWLKNNRMLSNSEQQKILGNRYSDIAFITDTTISIVASIAGIYQSNIQKNHYGVSSQTCIILYNINTDSYLVNPIAYYTNKTFPQAESILFNQQQSTVILSSNNFDAEKKRNYDSAWNISVLSLEGDRVQDIVALPAEYRNTSLGYNFIEVLYAYNQQNLFYMFNSLPYIIDNKTNDSIRLVNWPYKNDTFFLSAKQHQKQIPDSIVRNFLYMRNINFVSIKNNFFVSTNCSIKGINSFWILQEYNKHGILVKEKKINSVNSSLGKLQYVAFFDMSPIKYACLYLHENEGWRIEIKKWND